MGYLSTFLGSALLIAGCGGPSRPGPRAPAPEPAPPALTEGAAVEPPLRLTAVEAIFDEAGLRGAMALRRAGGRTELANPELATTAQVPCSTFKIPNTLIGLETGVIPDESFTLPWDGTEQYLDSWERDHDLTSALANSVVWYFQEVARRVGPERMAAWVTRLDYGDAEIGTQVDTFWLEGPLAISAAGQVDFLARLTAGELPLSARSVETLRRVMPRREQGDAVILAKTGLCRDDAASHGWLVGWVEQGGEVRALFALLLVGEPAEVSEIQHSRWPLSLRALERVGVLAAGAGS